MIDREIPAAPSCECGAREGQLHQFMCRWEYCPFCERQFVESCECVYELLGLKRRSFSPKTGQLLERAYSEGLTVDEEQNWLECCTVRGRIPYLHAPQLCARCGCHDPAIFMVQDLVWEFYAGPTFRDALVCEACFRAIKAAIDASQQRPEWVPDDRAIFEYLDAFYRGDREILMRLEPGKFAPRK